MEPQQCIDCKEPLSEKNMKFFSKTYHSKSALHNYQKSAYFYCHKRCTNCFLKHKRDRRSMRSFQMKALKAKQDAFILVSKPPQSMTPVSDDLKSLA